MTPAEYAQINESPCTFTEVQEIMSPFNPYGKPLGDPSCLKCALHTVMDDEYNNNNGHAFVSDLETTLARCTAFFASPRAYSDERTLAQHVKLFTGLMHCLSHEGPPDRATLARLLDCGGRMLMAVSNMYPETFAQCHRSDYDQYVRILTRTNASSDQCATTALSPMWTCERVM